MVCARYRLKHLKYINSFIPHSNSLKLVLLFSRWGNWSTEVLRNLLSQTSSKWKSCAILWPIRKATDSYVFVSGMCVHSKIDVCISSLFSLETQILIPKTHASPALFHSFTCFACPLKECEFETRDLLIYGKGEWINFICIVSP